MVKIIIGNLTSKIVGFLPDEVQLQLDKTLSYTIKDAYYLTSVKTKKWDGVYHLYRRNYGQTFYSGLLSLTEEVLNRNKIVFTRCDERIVPAKNLPHLKFTPTPDFEERDYQNFTIERALKASRGVLKMATGSGKTLVMARLIGRIQTAPFMFYVLTQDLLQQAHEVLSETLNEPIGRIGGGYFDIKKINVCTIQTAVMSLNLDNKAFKISDYKFDEEDNGWDEEQISGTEKLVQLKELIEATRGLVADECVDGNTEVITELGSVKIKDIKEKKCRFVQTYDGHNKVFKPILNWWNKGNKRTVRIKISNGKNIICTKNHLFYTKRGWVRAENLAKSDELLSVNVENIIICFSQGNHLSNCLKEYRNSCRNVCNINWQKIKNISKDKTHIVYDMAVKDTHCFFANGILVHNCHHASAKTVKDVLTASPYAYYRWGNSATPFREDGAEIMIQAMFGKKIVDISASYLIDHGYLIKPYILFDPIHHTSKFHSYQSIYKECISNNNEFNNHVAEIANHLIKRELSVLVLVQQYCQGEYLKKIIPSTEFLTGKMSREKRKQAIQDLRDRKSLCLISTTLADEGLDVPTLDAVLLAGGGASSTRVHQRIGRTLRIDKKNKNPRDKSIVVYFQHEGAKHLDKHTRKARRIIKTEPKFKIIDSGGPSFICNEIDEIMDLGQDKTTINNI